jgi:glucuronide carrier protein
MSGTIASERCYEFVEAKALLMDRKTRRVEAHPGVVTISRQAGSGAHVVAQHLLERLQARASHPSVPWKIFDHDLVERVIEEHDLAERMAKFMPEDRISAMSDTLDELFGLRPSSWSLVRQTAETILHLAELGDAVIIGRAGNLITRHIAGALHIRLVGSLEKRIAHVEGYLGLDHLAASEYVRTQDLGRKRYVETYYSKDIDDPLLYDLMINTDRVSYGEAARIIAEAGAARWETIPVGTESGPAGRPPHV